VALEGLPDRFRATAGSLVADPGAHDVAPSEAALTIRLDRIRSDAYLRSMALRILNPETATDDTVAYIVAALDDEITFVREAAAHSLHLFGDRLPLAPFLSAIRDKRALNFAWCLAAAHVFAAHADEVPIDALLDLFFNMSPNQASRSEVQFAVVQAMGRLGARATDEVVELLAGMLEHRQATHRPHDIRVRWQAANSLGELGDRAPTAPLVAGMDDHQPRVAAAAARALLRQPDRLTGEIRTRAQLMSDVQSARQVINERSRA
jgi:HEAT repeat protein